MTEVELPDVEGVLARLSRWEAENFPTKDEIAKALMLAHPGAGNAVLILPSPKPPNSEDVRRLLHAYRKETA